jgi:uncharacterized membrane protein
MKKLRIWASVALTLGFVGLVFLLLMFLALVDISHGETDVAGEWLIVRLGLLVIFFVIVAVFVGTGLVLKNFRDREDGKGGTDV